MKTYTIKTGKEIVINDGIPMNDGKLLLGGQSLDVNQERAMIEGGNLLALWIDDKKQLGASLINIIPPEEGMMEVINITKGEVIAFKNTPTGRIVGATLKKGGQIALRINDKELTINNTGKDLKIN